MPNASRPLKKATLRQLVTLQTLARLGSVSRTAQELHLTQPAVSLQLHALEETAGTPLLARGIRGVRLTEAGDLLAGYAERMLQLWDEAGEAMAAQRGQVAGTLRVGAVTTAEYLAPQLLLAFARQHDHVTVKLNVGNRAAIAAQLAQQEIDLAIMGRAPPGLLVQSTPFARHPMAFVASPRDPLARRRTLEIGDLAEARLLLRERGSGTRITVEALFRDAEVPMPLGVETTSNEAIKQMCAAGYGVAFLSLHACGLELSNGLLVQLPLAGHPVERQWHAISLADRPLPAVASAFAEFLRDEGGALVDAQMAATRSMPAPGAGAPRSRAVPSRGNSGSNAGTASAGDADVAPADGCGPLSPSVRRRARAPTRRAARTRPAGARPRRSADRRRHGRGSAAR